MIVKVKKLDLADIDLKQKSVINYLIVLFLNKRVKNLIMKNKIDFSGETVVERHLESLDREEVYEKLRHASWIQDNRSLNMALKDYGNDYFKR